jgi:type I restriction enzyme S subunit
MSFPRYPSYKHSGVGWIGTVPSHWAVSALKRFAQTITDGAHVSPETEDGIYPFVSTKDIADDNIDLNGCLRTSAESFRYLVRTGCRPILGDVLFSKDGTIGRTAVVRDAQEFVVASSLIIIRPKKDSVDPDFLNRLCQSQAVATQVETLVKGAGLPRLSIQNLTKIVGCFPPLVEQIRITAFLAKEIAKIDRLVGEQNRLIELLKEKRQAIISHVVTKGLNPDAPMKPSGVEWLGDVPAHWNVKKMKWIAEMRSGHTPDKKIPAYWDAGDIPWVSLNDTGYLKHNDYISETAYSITQLGIDNSSACLLPPKVVVFSRDATIGRCAITTRAMAVSQHFIAWVCGKDMIPEFLLLRLRSMTQELDRLTTGATLKTIGMPDVRTIVTPVPPLAEQRAIISWASTEKMRLDILTAETQLAIDLLQERRSALISAAVTGQIDVRGQVVETEAA